MALLIEIIATELVIDIGNVGSMTCKRRELQQGFEPDTSFSIQHEPLVRGRRQIDLGVDPPPDLVIEIEVTRPAIPKLPLYANMGVPEVWRSDGERVVFLLLRDRDYREAAASVALPPLTGEIVTRFLDESRSLRRTEWLRRVRDWAQAASSPRPE